MKPVFFKTSEQFRTWLEVHHGTSHELLVGFHKKDSGKKSISYPEALEEALCYGWIDGIRKNFDETSYTIRFTPRRSTSTWSVVNIGHVRRLTKLGRMKPNGLRVFRERDRKKSGIPDYKQIPGNLSVQVWRRKEEHVCHFWTVTRWDTVDSIKKFAGEYYEKVRYYPEDRKYLLEFESNVPHFETFEY